LLKIILKNTIKLTIGGIALGLLHKYDWLVALLLIAKIAHTYYKRKKNNTLHFKLVLGFFLTASLGLLAEFLGTEFHFWEYHDINTQLPLWLFFAWGAAFVIIYQTEEQILRVKPNISNTNKNLLLLFLVAFFPTLGEIIAIQLGTWTYYMPYQILGVPVAAIIALIAIHSVINFIVNFLSKKLQKTQ
jgi:uncharacterized membrane protein YoaT (DUF817 family)